MVLNDVEVRRCVEELKMTYTWNNCVGKKVRTLVEQWTISGYAKIVIPAGSIGVITEFWNIEEIEVKFTVFPDNPIFTFDTHEIELVAEEIQ